MVWMCFSQSLFTKQPKSWTCPMDCSFLPPALVKKGDLIRRESEWWEDGEIIFRDGQRSDIYNLYATLIMQITLIAMGRHWMVLSRGVTCFDFIFKKTRSKYSKGRKRGSLRKLLLWVHWRPGPLKTRWFWQWWEVSSFKICFEGEPTGLAAHVHNGSKGEWETSTLAYRRCF